MNYNDSDVTFKISDRQNRIKLYKFKYVLNIIWWILLFNTQFYQQLSNKTQINLKTVQRWHLNLVLKSGVGHNFEGRLYKICLSQT